MLTFFKKRQPAQRLRLFQLSIHVKRGGSREMPSELIGAYVPVFASGTSHEVAAQHAVTVLIDRGFEVVAICDGKIHELDPHRWDAFVDQAWPEFASQFPSQSEVCRELDQGFLFVDPFAGYTTSMSSDR